MPQEIEGRLYFEYQDDAAAYHTFDIRQPAFGYTVNIKMPVSISQADNGKYLAFDEGGGTQVYDVRECLSSIFLNQTDHSTLINAYRDNTKMRTRNITFHSRGGFYPFGPDKDDDGTYQVALEIIEQDGISNNFTQLYKSKLRLTFTGTSWPAQDFLGDDLNNGPMAIGTVTGCRQPGEWYRSIPRYTQSTVVTNGYNGAAKFTNRGSSGDSWITNFEFRGSTAKSQRVINYLTNTARADVFGSNGIPVTFPVNSYPFGYEKGSGGIYQVQLIQDTITMRHVKYNDWVFGLSFAYISGPI